MKEIQLFQLTYFTRTGVKLNRATALKYSLRVMVREVYLPLEFVSVIYAFKKL